MGILYVLFGICMFFEPSFNMFDILPDILGALLIIKGLSKLYLVNEDFSAARKNAKNLLIIFAIKIVLCVFAAAHTDYLLPFTFIFGTLEIIYMLSFFRNLYVGFDYTLQRYSDNKYSENVSSAFTMSAIFTVVSRVCAFAAHIPQIFIQDASVDLSYKASTRIPMTYLEPYIRLFCIIISLIVGVIFAVITVRFFAKVIKDKKYTDILKEKYTQEKELKKEVLLSQGIKTSLILCFAAFLFLLQFTLDGINVIPEFVGFVLLCFAFSRLSKLSGQKKKGIVLFAFGFVLSFVLYTALIRTNLGVNHISMSQSLKRLEFEALGSPWWAIFGVILSGAVYYIFYVCTLKILNLFENIFSNEKRKNAIDMLKAQKIWTGITLALCFLRNTVTLVMAFLVTNEKVCEFVVNRAIIPNQQEYDEYLQNAVVYIYEMLDKSFFWINLACVLCVLYASYHFIKIKSKTEGDE